MRDAFDSRILYPFVFRSGTVSEAEANFCKAIRCIRVDLDILSDPMQYKADSDSMQHKVLVTSFKRTSTKLVFTLRVSSKLLNFEKSWQVTVPVDEPTTEFTVSENTQLSGFSTDPVTGSRVDAYQLRVLVLPEKDYFNAVSLYDVQCALGLALECFVCRAVSTCIIREDYLPDQQPESGDEHKYIHLTESLSFPPGCNTTVTYSDHRLDISVSPGSGSGTFPVSPNADKGALSINGLASDNVDLILSPNSQITIKVLVDSAPTS